MRILSTVLLCASLAVPATADAGTVEVSVGSTGFTFDPAEVSVLPGDIVRFTNAGGFHNVKADDGSFENPAGPSSSAWVFDLTVTQIGDIRYYCEAHGGPGGIGMAGVIHVLDPDIVFRSSFE